VSDIAHTALSGVIFSTTDGTLSVSSGGNVDAAVECWKSVDWFCIEDYYVELERRQQVTAETTKKNLTEPKRDIRSASV
jgi:hypothetical protein